jgi:hypothetical protein
MDSGLKDAILEVCKKDPRSSMEVWAMIPFNLKFLAPNHAIVAGGISELLEEGLLRRTTDFGYSMYHTVIRRVDVKRVEDE